jgi:hypothetical protein
MKDKVIQRFENWDDKDVTLFLKALYNTRYFSDENKALKLEMKASSQMNIL